MTDNPLEPFMCLIANTKEVTKHFRQGAKLYCSAPLWGDGYEKTRVIGCCKGSCHYRGVILNLKIMENFRAKVIYEPRVLRKIAEVQAKHAYGFAIWEGETAAEYAELLKKRHESLEGVDNGNG